MTEDEFVFDAPNVCENLLAKQHDENMLNAPFDWFLKLHHHEAKEKEEGEVASVTQQQQQQQQQQANQPSGGGSNLLKKHVMAIQGTGVKRGGSKNPIPILTNDNIVKKKQKVVLTTNKRVAASSSNDLSAILRVHNAKHKQKSTYEPPRHSVRDVRRWEKKHLKVWSDLTHEEREIANSEISAEKKK